jgi:transcription elongation factor GreA
MNKVPMTVQGEAHLQKELEQLKRVDRPAIVSAIAEARAHGDLKENAEYHAAKERQGFIEGRIQALESKLSNAQVIDVTKLDPQGKVVFGATVVIKGLDIKDDRSVRYQIVGEDEADIQQAKISVQSPIARALIGKQEGDEVMIKTPGGEVFYEVMEVLY